MSGYWLAMLSVAICLFAVFLSIVHQFDRDNHSEPETLELDHLSPIENSYTDRAENESNDVAVEAADSRGGSHGEAGLRFPETTH